MREDGRSKITAFQASPNAFDNPILEKARQSAVRMGRHWRRGRHAGRGAGGHGRLTPPEGMNSALAQRSMIRAP